MYSQENLVAKNQELEHSQLIGKLDNLEVWRVGANELEKFSEFVFDVYVDNYQKRDGWEPVNDELRYMINEDKTQFSQSFYVALKNSDGEFLGSAKVTKMSPSLKFPIQTEFGYDLKQYFENANVPTKDFWHLGRFAINKHVLKRSNTALKTHHIFKRLLKECANYAFQSEQNMMIAEVDAMAYRISRLVSLNMRKMGEGKEYLGSFTYPIHITKRDMDIFLAHQH